MEKTKQSGQIVVILLLVMLVGLTLGLSITTRTLQQMKVTTISEQSARAFTGAEGAIEEALKQDLEGLIVGQEYPVSGLSDIQTAHYKVAEKSQEFTIGKDETYQLDLTSPNWNNNDINICWKDPDEDPKPSLELVFIQELGGDYSVERFPVNAEDTPGNCFLNPGTSNWPCGAGGSAGIANRSGVTIDECGGFTNQVDIPAASIADSIALRIKPFYSSAIVKIIGVAGQVYTVEGEATAVADVTRKVEVKKAPPALPPVFDYVIFDGSGNALKK